MNKILDDENNLLEGDDQKEESGASEQINKLEEEIEQLMRTLKKNKKLKNFKRFFIGHMAACVTMAGGSALIATSGSNFAPDKIVVAMVSAALFGMIASIPLTMLDLAAYENRPIKKVVNKVRKNFKEKKLDLAKSGASGSLPSSKNFDINSGEQQR